MKTKKQLVKQNTPPALVDENKLYRRIAEIIETRKCRAGVFVNSEMTLMFWEVGRHINSVVLGDERAGYGKRILSTLSTKLTTRYGKVFAERNIYRMAQFAEQFTDLKILSELTTKLNWSHLVELLPLKSNDAFMYYAQDAAERRLGVRELRRQISRKAYERREIANTQLTNESAVPFNVFKDPYILDTLGLRENYLEADLEKAILADIGAFVLEFGHGFTFVERQKRMIIDGEDVVLDLLFYNRNLRRLVAVELKLGEFKAGHMGQMLLYLKWLDKYERREGEEAPLGIILCASKRREKIELLEMDKAGIAVAEYWTQLPPKAEFEERIRNIVAEARERLERRKSLPASKIQKQIDWFVEPKGEDDE